jgi:hypothetical protein
MGHYVLSRLMGFVTSNVSVEVTGPESHSGAASIHLAESVHSLHDVTIYLERRVLVLYAGAMAETLPPGHVPQTGVDNEKAVQIIRGGFGAEQDHAKAREAIHLLRNILHPGAHDASVIDEQLSALDLRLWNRTLALVEEFEKTIVGVAYALTQHLEAKQPRGSYIAVFTKEALDEIPALKALPLLQP